MSDNISEIVKRKMATTGTISPAPPEYQLCIHLGLTNSAAAIYWQHSGEYKFASVKDNEGQRLIPSCVSFSRDTNEILVGKSAEQKKDSECCNTIFDARKLIGRSFYDRQVEEFQATHPIMITNIGNHPVIELIYNKETSYFRPLDISAYVLKHIRECAEQTLRAHLGIETVEIDSAMITVPPYFQQKQKSETLQAARNAGFTNDVHLINEHIAVVHYLGCWKARPARNVIVFNFDDEFDVSVLEMEHTSSQIKTLYMDGDSNLSELDIHGKLFKFCISEIQQHWHKNCDSRSVRIELFKMCAELKADLSDGKEASINLNRLFPDLNANISISRKQFEELISPLLMRAIQVVKNALKKSHVEPTEIDSVLLVGRSSHIPMVLDLFKTEIGIDVWELHHSWERNQCMKNAVRCKVLGSLTFGAKLSGVIPASFKESMLKLLDGQVAPRLFRMKLRPDLMIVCKPCLLIVCGLRKNIIQKASLNQFKQSSLALDPVWYILEIESCEQFESYWQTADEQIARTRDRIQGYAIDGKENCEVYCFSRMDICIPNDLFLDLNEFGKIVHCGWGSYPPAAVINRFCPTEDLLYSSEPSLRQIINDGIRQELKNSLKEQPNSPINLLLADIFCDGVTKRSSLPLGFDEVQPLKHVTARISYNPLHLVVWHGNDELFSKILCTHPQYTKDKAKFKPECGTFELNVIHLAILASCTTSKNYIIKKILQNNKLSYMHEAELYTRYICGSEENEGETLKFNALHFAVLVNNIDAAEMLLENPYNAVRIDLDSVRIRNACLTTLDIAVWGGRFKMCELILTAYDAELMSSSKESEIKAIIGIVCWSMLRTIDSFGNVELFDWLLNYLNRLDSKFHKIVKRGLEVVADYFSETLYCAYALKSIENCLKRLNHNEINLWPDIKERYDCDISSASQFLEFCWPTEKADDDGYTADTNKQNVAASGVGKFVYINQPETSFISKLARFSDVCAPGGIWRWILD